VRPPIRLLTLAILLTLPFAALAQSGQWGPRGIARRFALQNGSLFVADGRGVSVYDATTLARLASAESETESVDLAPLPDHSLIVATRSTLERYLVGADGRLSLQSSTPIPGVTRLAASADGLLAGATPSGVVLWRPSSESFAQLGGFAIRGTINALAVRGNALFAAVDGEGISVIDVTGGHDTAILSDDAKDFALAGNLLFIAAGVNGLTVADVTDPWSPRVLARAGSGGMNALRVAAAGGRVALAEPARTIQLFDVTLPDAPRQTATLDEPVQALAMSGARLLVSGSIVDAFGLTTETGIPVRAYDVSGAPRVAGEARDLAGPVTGVATDGSLAYVVDRPLLRVIDVSITAAPREIASLPIDAIGDRVKLQGKQLLIYGRGDVQLVDVADPYHPRMVNVFHSNGRPPSNAAFSRNGIIEGNVWTGFHVVDFNFPMPAIIASIKSHYYDVVSDGDDAAYLGAEGHAVAAVDLGTRGAATEKSQVTVGVVQAALAAATPSHPPLLLVRARDGLHVYSLADRFHPAELSAMPMDFAGALAASGDSAYIATGSGLVSVLDLTHPEAPQLAASALKSVAPMQIAVAGGKVVVADRYSLRIYGANTPSPPPPPPPTPPARHRAASH
jgi:hypothetical protein